ncbi:MAG: SGNH/GDSL hydrolase family protein [Planctomycetes bacterium]|nr:SGNH/GDSL hydrolase family protein [Planctomycetota bacterium]
MSAGKKLGYGLVTNAALLAVFEATATMLPRAPEKLKESPVEFVGNDRTGRFPTEFDPQLFWKIPGNAQIPDLRPCVEEKVNSHGFRGPEFNDQKAGGVKRIVFLGDSNTFGMGVEGDETYVYRTMRWLQTAKNARWEIINTAVPGYSAFQMQTMLETRVSKFQPDIVVIYAGAWNDYTPAIGLDDEKAFRQLQQLRGTSAGLFHDLHLFQYIAEILKPSGTIAQAAEKKPSKQEEYRKIWSERMERPDGPRLEKDQFRRVLRTIVERAKSYGSKVIFVTPPVPYKTRTRFADGENYAKIFSEVGIEIADAVADARTTLFSNSEEKDKLLFCDIIHPTPFGHARVARVLCDAIRKISGDAAPDAGTELFDREPLDLKELQKSADNFVGAAMTPVDGKTAYEFGGKEHEIVGPPPYRIIYKDLALPPNPAIRCGLTFFKKDSLGAASRPVKSTRFELRIQAAGEPEKVVFSVDKEATGDGEWAGPYSHRIDLGEFGGKTVTLTLETKGEAAIGSWGRVYVYPYR